MEHAAAGEGGSTRKTDPAHAEMIGRRIGNYEVTGHLDQGGMGSLYLARHVILDRCCVLKTMQPQARMNPAVTRRFLREIRLGAMLVHPHVITYYDAGILDDRFYLVMEYFPGKDLHRRFHLRPAPPGTIRRIGLQIASALAAAHARRILHRDLKPKNILLHDSGHAKICDFGLSKILDIEEQSRITTMGTLMGSPAFLAPESLEGAQAATERSDIYGLGAVLYFCATGHAPYEGVNVMDVLQKIGQGFPLPRSLRADVPPWLEDLILTAMQKDPARRFPSMEAMHEAFAKVEAEVGAPSTAEEDPLRDTVVLARAEAVSAPHLRMFSLLEGACEWPLTKADTLLGRGEQAEIPMLAESVSRRHARIRRRPDGVWLEDAGSRGGVFLDGARIQEAVQLRHGSMFLMSCYVVEYREDAPQTLGEGGGGSEGLEVLTYAPLPAGLKVQYRSLAGAGTCDGTRRIAGAHGGILLPMVDALQDVLHLEIRILWPTGESMVCMGEFRGILYHTSKPLMRIALSTLPPGWQERKTGVGGVGAWVPAPPV